MKRLPPSGNTVYITKQQREACPKDKLLQEASEEIGYLIRQSGDKDVSSNNAFHFDSDLICSEGRVSHTVSGSWHKGFLPRPAWRLICQLIHINVVKWAPASTVDYAVLVFPDQCSLKNLLNTSSRGHRVLYSRGWPFCYASVNIPKPELYSVYSLLKGVLMQKRITVAILSSLFLFPWNKKKSSSNLLWKYL